eukprot:TRINITY_DN50616_c0_g1_i1.p3 TRINITY_DN50616_c0_g1~~TRINITY_DN50616_c0_g1_i1.p3  ORF type:complete len:290 (+),score=79.00 TRINITY_DN50616_c0_g1_i1:85-870(+)
MPSTASGPFLSPVAPQRGGPDPRPPAPPALSEARARGAGRASAGSGRSGRRLRELGEALQQERELFAAVQQQVSALEVRRQRLEQELGAAGERPLPRSAPASARGRPAEGRARAAATRAVPLQFLRPHAAMPYRADPGRSSRRTAYSRDHLGQLVIGSERSCEWVERCHLRSKALAAVAATESQRREREAASPALESPPWSAQHSGTRVAPYRMRPAGLPSVLPVEAFHGKSCSRQRFYGDQLGRRILVDLHDAPRISAVE